MCRQHHLCPLKVAGVDRRPGGYSSFDGLGERPVDVDPAEAADALGGLLDEHTLDAAKNRDVERPASEVENKHALVVLDVACVGHRRCGRFVQQRQHFDAREPGRHLGAEASHTATVGRNGDDGGVEVEPGLGRPSGDLSEEDGGGFLDLH